MSRPAMVLVVAVAVTACCVAAGPVGAGTSRLSFVQVAEKEWTVTPSRPRVRAGSVSIELVNFGMDAHNLVVKGTKKGSKAITFEQLDPRGRTERTLRLAPGRYSLYCSLPGHKARGMRTMLVVTR